MPFETPTILETHLQGFDASQGTLPSDLRVLGDLTGPEIEGVLTIETTANEPLRVPALSLKGEYRVDNIRLVQGHQLLAYAEPRSASVLVTEVLITKVTSRALTMDEIRSHGIVIGDSFKAYNFTFGFAVAGETFDYNVPVLWQPAREVAHFLGVEEAGTAKPHFSPPRMLPFVLSLTPEGGPGAQGGCSDPEGCDRDAAPPIPGVIVFPTDTRLLNQFFSIILLAQNGAPAGDRLVIRDLTAKISLPPGLRQAQTEPPTQLGVPVPVHVPGPDGKLGTADDITFLVAQATGQAEFLAEGLREGTHVVTIDLDGVLEGLPAGIRHLTGQARGAVVVRDPSLNVTITHPETVRTDEEYSLLLTISNTSTAPANALSITLPSSRLSGVEVVGSNQRAIDTLLPGDSQLVEFRLRALRTGRVVASAARSDGHVTPSFELTMGVGEAGIPVSPTTIILPRATDRFPGALQRDALRLLGLGFSLATAPSQALRAGLPQVDRATVDKRVAQLAEAATSIDLGESIDLAAGAVLFDWLGVRDQAWEWDKLRRTTSAGLQVSTDLASLLGGNANASPSAVAERLFSSTQYLPPHLAAVADGAGAEIEISSRTSGKVVNGRAGSDRIRDLPFADVVGVQEGQMALIAVPEPGGYEAKLRVPTGGEVTLEWLLPNATGQYERWTWPSVPLGAAGVAVAAFGPDVASPVLRVDADGNGVFEREVPPAVARLEPVPFEAIAAVQDARTDPSGHVIEVLLSSDIDPASFQTNDPSRFQIPDKVSDGGHFALSGGVYAETVSQRVVRVVFNNPLSPYRAQRLTLRGLRSTLGLELPEQTLEVETRVTMPGTLVEGQVIGPDGHPVPHATVHLIETDYSENPFAEEPCVTHQTAAVQSGDDGKFLFDYVRQTDCGNLFSLRASDASSHSGEASGRVRFVGETVHLNVVMLGRGQIHGRVTYADGVVPDTIEVMAFNPVFKEGRAARIDANGLYDVGDLPVGTITLAARDGLGNSVAQTLEVPSAGAVVERNLVLPRRSQDPTGELSGTVVKPDGTTPVSQAWVALYVKGDLVGVRTSGVDGGFDFGVVPAGAAAIEAFSGETGVAGANVSFTLAPDRANVVTVRLLDQQGTVQGHVYRRGIDGTNPLAGAIVYVGGLPFHTATDAQGAYVIEGVPAGLWSVTAADLAQNTMATESVTLSADREVVTRDLYLEDKTRGAIGGEVLGFDGLPVPGATVHLALDDQHWHHETVTDTAGKFTLPDLSPGPYAVHAFKGTAGGARQAEVRFPGDVPFVSVRFKRGSIHGSIKARNESGALVGVRAVVSYKTTVVRDGLLGLAYQATDLETDAQGNYALNGVLTGPYVITAIHPFYGSRTLRDALVNDGEVQQKDFVFERNGAVRGTVFDYDGVTPLPGARVVLRHPAFADYAVETDAAGRFSFELVPPTSYGFAVEASIDQGMIFRVGRTDLQPLRQGQELDVELVMLKQGTVTGQLQMASGSPVAGATMTLTETRFPNRKLQVQTDASGAFAFRNVFEGTASIAAWSLNGLGGKNTTVIATEGEERSLLVQLQEIGEIHGRLLSPVDGAPVASASVTLLRGGRLFDATNSDQDGRFQFTILPLDSYEIRALDYRTGRQGRSATLPVAIDGQVVETVVVLEARGTVSGQVIEPGSRRVVPGATVALTHIDSGFRTYSSTDAEGTFEFGGIPQGSFFLSTREPAGRRTATAWGQIAREGENVRLDLILEASGTLRGSVLSPGLASSELFPHPAVFLWQQGSQIGGSIDNPFVFEGVLAGKEFELDVHEQGGLHRGSASGVLLHDGDDLTVNVKMWPIGQAHVHVVDGSGHDVPNANVTLVSSGPYGGWFNATADPTGSIAFLNVGSGSLTAYAKDPITQLAGSEVGAISDEGDDAHLTISLQPSARITARILKADGTTPADVLAVLQIQGRTYYARTAEDGSLLFPAVPIGDFLLRLFEQSAPGYRRMVAGSRIGEDLVALGDVLLDDRDPTVVSIQPGSGATGVPVRSEVLVHFSEPLDPIPGWTNWAQLDYQDAGGHWNAVGADWSFRDGGTTIAIVPRLPLPSFTTFIVRVSEAVDLAGRTFDGMVTSLFTTVDAIPPFVQDSSPAQGAVNQATDLQIRVRFSEAVASESVAGAALQLHDGESGVGLGSTSDFNPETRTVIVTPTQRLAEDHPYELVVQGVRDLSGNAMAAPYALRFATRDLTPPIVESIAPDNDTVVTAGDHLLIGAIARDNQHVARVDFSMQGQTGTAVAPPFVWEAIVQPVEREQDVVVEAVAVDDAGNHGSGSVHLHVLPRVDPDAPTLKLLCPSDGARLAPGTSLELRGEAGDPQGLRKVEIFVNGSTTPAFSSADSPFRYRLVAPSTMKDGDTIHVQVVASDYGNKTTQTSLDIPIVGGAVVTGDFVLTSGNPVFEHRSVIVTAGTLTLEGHHTLRDLILLGEARATHAVSATTGEFKLELELERDLYVGCDAAIDATDRGYRPGDPAWSYPNSQAEGAHGMRASHGGRGNNYNGTNPTYDSLFDPRDSGAGSSSEPGGGVIRIKAHDAATIDGFATARGHAAGGTVKLEAGRLGGLGWVHAEGSHESGGGRIALIGGVIDAGFADRAWAPGLDGTAGTIYVRRGNQRYGDLIVDNGYVEPIEDEATDLLPIGSGVVTSATESSITNVSADFRHGIDGARVTFGSDRAHEWTILANEHHGQTLQLDTTNAALPAVVGGTYEGVYHFDNVLVRHGATLWTRDRLISESPIRVEPGSYFLQGDYAVPDVGVSFAKDPRPGTTVRLSAYAASAFGIRHVHLDVTGAVTKTADYDLPGLRGHDAAWDLEIPGDPASDGFRVHWVVTDGHGTTATKDLEATWESDHEAPVLSLMTTPVAHAGESFVVYIRSQDNRGVRSTSLTIFGHTYQWPTGGQIEQRVEAPLVTEATSAMAIAEAVDGAGNRATTSAPISIVPAAIRIVSIEPTEGATVVAGSVVNITATADSQWPIRHMTMVVDGQTFTSNDREVAANIFAPATATSAPLSIQVEAEDTEGAHASGQRTLEVVRAADTVPPRVELTCPGRYVVAVPGTTLGIRFRSDDDQRVARVDVLVGEATEPLWTRKAGEIQQGANDFEVSVPLPAGIPPGGILAVRVRATDYAMQVAEAVIDVHLIDATPIFSMTLAADDRSLEGKTVLVDGTLVVQGAHTFQNLYLLGGLVSGMPTTSSETKALDLHIGGDVYVGCHGAISTDAQGYLGAPTRNEPAYTYPNVQHGATHGSGGEHQYGNLFHPAEPGAGGGSNIGVGASGGGVLRLAVDGTLRLDGSITARGESRSYSSGGGAGGSIELHAAAIDGAGLVSAAGGSGGENFFYTSGAGGGGRIAIYGGTISDGIRKRISATGGRYFLGTLMAHAGTIFIRSSDAVFGDLIVSGGGPTTYLPSLGGGYIDAATSESLTDLDTRFHDDVRGSEVFINEHQSVLWPVTAFEEDGQTLRFSSAGRPFDGVAGDFYRALMRFDHIRVGERANLFSRDLIVSSTAPEVDASSSFYGGNVAGPTLLADRLSMRLGTLGLEVVGSAGAVADPDEPLSLRVMDLTSGEVAWGSAESDGSFVIHVSARAADVLRVTAFDGASLAVPSVSVDLAPLAAGDFEQPELNLGNFGIERVATAGSTLALLGQGELGETLILVSLADPLHPEKLSELPLPDLAGPADDMVIHGQRVALALGGGLASIHIDDPRAPTFDPAADVLHLLDDDWLVGLQSSSDALLGVSKAGAVFDIDLQGLRVRVRRDLPLSVGEIAFDRGRLWSLTVEDNGDHLRLFDLSTGLLIRELSLPGSDVGQPEYLGPMLAERGRLLLQRVVHFSGDGVRTAWVAGRIDHGDLAVGPERSGDWQNIFAVAIPLGDHFLLSPSWLGAFAVDGVAFSATPLVDSGLSRDDRFFEEAGYLWSYLPGGGSLHGRPSAALRPWLEADRIRVVAGSGGASIAGSVGAALWHAERVVVRSGTLMAQALVAADGSFAVSLAGVNPGDDVELQALNATGASGNVVSIRTAAP